MSVFRSMLTRLGTSLTHRPTPAYLSYCSPLWYRRPLDFDDDQMESVQVKKTQQRPPHSQQFVDDSQSEWGEGEAPDAYGQGVGHKDALHTQTKSEGPTERCINQVVLMGRVGADPQIRGTEARPITTFSLATNSVWKTQNPGPGDSEWTHRVDWHNVVVFKPGLRESAYSYVHKGCRVHITGRVIYGEMVDRQGVRRHTTTIACEDIIYLTRKM